VIKPYEEGGRYFSQIANTAPLDGGSVDEGNDRDNDTKQDD